MQTVAFFVQREVLRDITAGIGITCVIYGLSLFMPVIGFFGAMFVPLPVLFYRAKLGRAPGLTVLVAATAVMAAILGRLSVDILFFIEMMLLGFTISELFDKHLSIEKTVLYASGVVLVSGLGSILIYCAVAGIGLFDLVSRYVAENLKLTLALYESMGVSQEAITVLSNSLEQIQYVLIRIMPALISASVLLVAWANILMARPVMNSRSLPLPDFGSLNRWRAPEPLVWALIASGLAILIPDKSIKMLGVNGILMLLTIYFFQGIAIVSFFFEKKQFPRLVRILLYFLIALQQIFLLIVIGLGVFDMWMDFRKLNTKKE
jgi:uncharacterized protein YybS (DUF2232 family)